MHAKLARLIRCGRDHATLVRPSANHDGLAAQSGIEELFHGDKEGVHVDVEDGLDGGLHKSILAEAPSGLKPLSKENAFTAGLKAPLSRFSLRSPWAEAQGFHPSPGLPLRVQLHFCGGRLAGGMMPFIRRYSTICP